ncbi:hypothetical protein P152DRAFT_405522 [Eremomyces bilateralis CBS 781.70]|uniref:VHS domain-containing protein n=1 Tax=Eremomyces bilateralis CBS 781.70 TaxID=1392243 RepID=A0A6G1FRK1_9PEZI|nr:uncharacterized protein P152DRAFT_405522 [Eremomyces bilateralis CBS 781.70]KAF1808403.1 hypothetical protein P152DRAFT_405522 [Eremomyces bilateralis CBS 781.70]
MCTVYIFRKLFSCILKQKKPYSAITVQIERLTSEAYEEHDLAGIVDLVEVIRIQDTGPTEAARAIRKKLKYGSPHKQLRALTILDALIQNAGKGFQRTFADEPLLERLRIVSQDDMVDAEVRQKCNVLFRQWAAGYKNKQGLQGIASLYKQLPKTRRPQPQQSRVVRETEADTHEQPPSPTATRSRGTSSATVYAGHSRASSSTAPISLGNTTPPSSSIFRSSKDKKSKAKPFNLEKERHQILETIASASVASTNLVNALKLINRESQRVSENPEVMKRFDTCKRLRRQILRYIQLVESEQYIGSLLSANDELVKALMAFEVLDKSMEDDSDSDNEALQEARSEFIHEPARGGGVNEGFSRLSMQEQPPARQSRPSSMSMPPPIPSAASKHRISQYRPEPEPEDEVDDDDPFGDQNAVKTPYVEKGGMTW